MQIVSSPKGRHNEMCSSKNGEYGTSWSKIIDIVMSFSGYVLESLWWQVFHSQAEKGNLCFHDKMNIICHCMDSPWYAFDGTSYSCCIFDIRVTLLITTCLEKKIHHFSSPPTIIWNLRIYWNWCHPWEISFLFLFLFLHSWQQSLIFQSPHHQQYKMIYLLSFLSLPFVN